MIPVLGPKSKGALNRLPAELIDELKMLGYVYDEAGQDAKDDSPVE